MKEFDVILCLARLQALTGRLRCKVQTPLHYTFIIEEFKKKNPDLTGTASFTLDQFLTAAAQV